MGDSPQRAWKASLGYAHRRAGIYLNRSRRSIWVHAETIADFEAIAGLVRGLRPLARIDRILFTSADARTCDWLRRRYPNDNAVPVPWDFAPLLDRFFERLNPLLLIRLGGARGLPARLIARARERGIAVVEIDRGTRLERLAPFVAALPGDPLADPTAPRRMTRIASSRLGLRVAERLAARRLPDWPSLVERLGRPRSILCLGNGPSAEDPVVRRVPHDCLMRVNWRWRERGILCRPDVVFVGDLRTTLELDGCAFGFRDVAWEREILLRHALFGMRCRRIEHFTLERVAPTLVRPVRGVLPTNGAVMIATAAALEPDRLTIAGIDLYRDPRGRYPWDGIADNDFPQMHRAEMEVATIRRALESHRGEVVILSEPLRRALEESPPGPDRPRSSA